MQEEELIKKRFNELKNRALFGGYTTFTDFLGLEEQDLLSQCAYPNEVTLFGGFDSAERVVAAFGDREVNNEDFPISCVKIVPKSEKFAQNLTHRDYLGTLMGLGIKRSVIGDILISSKTAYVFCISAMAQFVCDSVSRVARTDVRCEITNSIDREAMPVPKHVEAVVSSLRLDVLVGEVYSLSRNETDKLFLQQKVFENGRLITRRSYIPKEGSKISVRGYGRFVFSGALRQTKKGRTVAALEVYG